MTEFKKMLRTTTSLVSTLFDTIDRLNAKEIDPEHARAISHTAKTIVGVAALELEYHKLNEGSKAISLSSITIEAAPVDSDVHAA